MSPKQYRADIDGLRAIAVTAVVIYHAVPDLLPSGFVGVDIFFVISGYLIGGIIYSAVNKRAFSFSDFYSRRAKRILPALIVVVLATFVAGLFLLDSMRLKELSNQSIAALIGVSNVYFWEHTDYFATASELQPLLMTWSLAVEEQFYVLFPFFMFALFKVPARLRFAVMSGFTVLSFVFLLWLAGRDPVSSFYLLPTRAWELSIGASLAIAHKEDVFGTLSAGLTHTIAAIGAILVGLSIFAFGHGDGFPTLPIALSVIGTACLIQTRESWINRKILSISVVVFIGLISYSWYLWHWPIMAYFRIVSDGVPNQLALVLAVPLSFGAAILSWRFVEQPFRRPSGSAGTTLMVAGAAMAATLLVPLSGRLTDGWPQRLPAGVQTIEAMRLEGRGTCLLGFDQSTPDTSVRCNPDGARIALMGDSHASALGPGLEAFAESRGTSIIQHTKSSCGPYLGFSYSGMDMPSVQASCGPFVEAAVNRILSDPSIETLVVAAYWEANSEETARIYSDGKLGDRVGFEQAVEQGVVNLIVAARRAGKSVILVADVPNFDLNTMSRTIGDHMPVRRALRRLVGIDRAVGEAEDGLVEARDMPMMVERFLSAQADMFDHVTYFDMRSQLCDGQACMYLKDGLPVYFDRHHLSAFGSRLIDWTVAFDTVETIG